MKLFLSLSIFVAFGSLYFAFQPKAPLLMEEICDNGLDDDGDDLIDLNDPDCNCPVYTPPSLIPNPSFEDTVCCPTGISELACAKDWIQASEATTDLLHMCGWMGWPLREPPLPFPDGEAIAGFHNGRFIGTDAAQPNWKEYIAACLLGSMTIDRTYRLQLYVGFSREMSSPSANIVLYGTSSCDNLPFGKNNQNHGCPLNGEGWFVLDSVRLEGIDTWIPTEFKFKPNYEVHAIAIGNDCEPNPNTMQNYYFVDNLVLATEVEFEVNITATGEPCRGEYKLSIPDIFPEGGYQWYQDGIALVGETSPELIIKTGEGKYEVKFEVDGQCQISDPFNFIKPQAETFDVVTICEGETYFLGEEAIQASGYYQAMLSDRNGCDSLAGVRLTVLEEIQDTVSAKIFQGETYQLGNQRIDQPGIYTETLISQYGCDSTVLLNLDYYNLFVPNAFSPNDDGVNDIFKIEAGPELSEIISFRVFDRWGDLVHQAQNTFPGDQNNGWDGRIQGAQAPMGVYLYMVQFEMKDGVERNVSGEVVLLR